MSCVIGATNRPEPDRPGAAPPGPVRRADLCRHARHRRAAADPRDPHQGHAAGQGRRPRSARPAHRALHRRRPRGSGPPRRPDRASPRARQRRGDDGRFRGGADGDPRLGDRRRCSTEYARIQETLKSDAVRPVGGIGFVLPGHAAAARARQGRTAASLARGEPAAGAQTSRPSSSAAPTANGQCGIEPRRAACRSPARRRS